MSSLYIPWIGIFRFQTLIKPAKWSIDDRWEYDLGIRISVLSLVIELRMIYRIRYDHPEIGVEFGSCWSFKWYNYGVWKVKLFFAHSRRTDGTSSINYTFRCLINRSSSGTCENALRIGNRVLWIGIRLHNRNWIPLTVGIAGMSIGDVTFRIANDEIVDSVSRLKSCHSKSKSNLFVWFILHRWIETVCFGQYKYFILIIDIEGK